MAPTSEEMLQEISINGEIWTMVRWDSGYGLFLGKEKKPKFTGTDPLSTLSSAYQSYLAKKAAADKQKRR